MVTMHAVTAARTPFRSLQTSPETAADKSLPPRLMIVDDDDDFRGSLALFLADQGFKVAECASGRSALERFRAGEPVDLILLDWRMPEMNGLELLQSLRQQGVDAPTVFLTALTDDVHEEAALSGGAVDFVDKSRISKTLLKRIELVTARQRSATERQENEIQLGGLTLRFDVSRALWRGERVELTVTEFRMVARLALKAGEDISYRELYDLVHGKDFVAGCGEHGYRVNVRTFIKRIRRKFGAIDPSFACIENYGGFGYRWAVQ
jgi:two-component system, OmpR family, response regulator ChvI